MVEIIRDEEHLGSGRKAMKRIEQKSTPLTKAFVRKYSKPGQLVGVPRQIYTAESFVLHENLHGPVACEKCQRLGKADSKLLGRACLSYAYICHF